ncbi:aspartic proteinase NANA, chloroplast-like [Miscanthus floridulus]|uniref:aspartic proteinase NANA, chloroplast-like n=1 Tax=Miscanthus floridulus TaxID=154761 RepID=UPI003457B9B1
MALRSNLLVSLLLFAAAAAASGKSARLDLVPAGPGAPLASRVRDDQRRHLYISARLRSRHGGSRRVAAEVASSSAVSLPMSSGAYSGTGQYFVKLLVGTPAQEFTLVADTGSDLTWVKCAGSSPSGRVFRPKVSKSWAPIPCSSDTCKLDVPFSLANCSSSASPCSYDYRYKEGSAGARGIVGTESATIALPGGKVAQLKGVILGCSSSHDGQSFRSADGVLSLGNAKISFATRAAERFGGSFSYCLVDHLAPRNATGYLAFGPGQVPRTPATQTKLFLDPQMPFYGVKVDAIHVAGKALDIPAEVWDAKSGGVILDSGNTLTVLAAPAYKAVVTSLSRHLDGVPKVSFPPFEHCYNWTARRPGAPEIPKLAVQFAGSARLEPPAKSYVIDVKPGVKCIGVQEGEWPGVSVIGNIMQQEHLWEFDLKNMQVRFKQSNCTR